jgi:TM2 domain-containing membrane protein YozV
LSKKEKHMYCTNCGTRNPDTGNFCSNCGNRLCPPQQESQPVYQAPPCDQKSRMAAGLLGIFLGSLGIHRFYLGYTTIGVIQIVVTVLTFGIGGLWGFVEGIMIFAGAINRDAQGRPLKD